MSGITEFSVPTDVLQDQTLKKSGEYHNFHIVGNKGPLTQGPSSVIDPETCIDYFTQANRNGIACWDTKTELTPETFSKYYTIKYSRASLVRSSTWKLLVSGRNHLLPFCGIIYFENTQLALRLFNKLLKARVIRIIRPNAITTCCAAVLHKDVVRGSHQRCLWSALFRKYYQIIILAISSARLVRYDLLNIILQRI